MNKHKQAGSLLVTSLFVAIVLLALGFAMVRVMQGSAHSNAVEYLGARAFLAAQSGAELGLNALFPLDGSASSCANVSATLPLIRSFNTSYLVGCQVSINCTELNGIADVSSPSGSINVYRITSSGNCPISTCAIGQSCRKNFWQTQRTINVEAKTLN